jgi:pimeloyl-ACP methyl ester carboxylesterase
VRKNTIVFLRGVNWYGAECVLFNNFKKYFKERSFEVVIPRFKGRTIDGSLRSLEKEIEKYKLKKFILLGFSFGGLVAQRYRDKYPDKVSELILVSSLDSRGITWKLLFNLLCNIIMGLRFFELSAIAKNIFYGNNFSDNEAKYYMEFNKRYKCFESPMIMLEPFPFMRIFGWRHIGKIKTPSLVVAGSNDNIISADYQQKLAENINAEFVKIIGAGHCLPIEPKLWVNAAEKINNWLQENKKRP